MSSIDRNSGNQNKTWAFCDIRSGKDKNFEKSVIVCVFPENWIKTSCKNRVSKFTLKAWLTDGFLLDGYARGTLNEGLEVELNEYKAHELNVWWIWRSWKNLTLEQDDCFGKRMKNKLAECALSQNQWAP